MAKRQQVEDLNTSQAIQPVQQVTDSYISPGYFQEPQNEMIDIARSLAEFSPELKQITGDLWEDMVERETEEGIAQVSTMTEEELDEALASEWRKQGLPDGASPVAQKAIRRHAGAMMARTSLEKWRIEQLDRFSDPYSTEDPREALQAHFETLNTGGFYASSAAAEEFNKQANVFSQQVYQTRSARTSEQLREDLTDNISEALKGWRLDEDGSFDKVEELIGIGYSRHGIAGDVEFFNAFHNIYLEAREDQDPKAGELLKKFESIKVGSATMGKRYASELYDLENAGDRAEEHTERKERNDRTDQLLKASDAISVLIFENRRELADMGAAKAQNFIEDELEKDETLDRLGVAKAMEQFPTLYAKAAAPSTDITDATAFRDLWNAVVRGEITVKEARLQSLGITMSNDDVARMDTVIKSLEDDRKNNRLRPYNRRLELEAQGLRGIRDIIEGDLVSQFYKQELDLMDHSDARSRAANQTRLSFNGEVDRKVDSLIAKHWDDEATLEEVLSNIREELTPWASQRIEKLTEGVEAPARKSPTVAPTVMDVIDVTDVLEEVQQMESLFGAFRDDKYPSSVGDYLNALTGERTTPDEITAARGKLTKSSSEYLHRLNTLTRSEYAGIHTSTANVYTFQKDGIHKYIFKARGQRFISVVDPQVDQEVTTQYFLARSYADPLTIEELTAKITREGVGIPAEIKDPKRYLFVNNRNDLESMAVEYDVAVEESKENGTPIGKTRVGDLLIAMGVEAGRPADFFRYQSLLLGLKPVDVKGSN